jgi:hypothetical protein
MDVRNELYYSSPEEVVGIGGIDKVDFGCENDEDLNTYLINILKEAKSVIDNYTKKTYTEIPEGIHGVARDYCLNVLANARTISQQNGSRMEYNTYPQFKVFTEDLKERLDAITGTSWKDSSTVRCFFFNSSKEVPDEEI